MKQDKRNADTRVLSCPLQGSAGSRDEQHPLKERHRQPFGHRHGAWRASCRLRGAQEAGSRLEEKFFRPLKRKLENILGNLTPVRPPPCLLVLICGPVACGV